jgi:hypothetical protein
MANFVGFASSPKPDPKRKTKKHEFTLELTAPLRDLLQTLSTADGYSLLIDEVIRFDFRPGGRLKFSHEDEEYGGTFSQISIPRSIVLNTERHGELSFSFRDSRSRARVNLKMKKALLPEEESVWLATCSDIEQRLRSNFGV